MKKKKRQRQQTKSMEIKNTKDGVGRVSCNLVIGSITNQTLIVSEGNIGRSQSIALVIWYYLYTIMLPHSHA